MMDGRVREFVTSVKRFAVRVRSALTFFTVRTAVPVALLVAAVAAYVLVAFLPVLLESSFLGKLASTLRGLSPSLVPQSLEDPTALANSVYLGVAAFGGVVVLATFKDLANSIPNYREFVKQPSFAALVQPAALTFVAFLGLSMSLFAVGGVSREKPTLHLTFKSTLPPGEFRPEDGLLKFYVVFSKEAGPDAIKDTADASISTDPLFQRLLNNLVSDLTACIERPEDRVELVVAGFASSSAWDEVQQKADAHWIDEHLRPLVAQRGAPNIPEAFNVWAADQRASSVLRVLEEARKSVPQGKRGAFVLRQEPLSFSEMRRRVFFKDVSDIRGFSSERALLTRRVDIRVLQVGDCLRGQSGQS